MIADAKRALAALSQAVKDGGISSPDEWQRQVAARNHRWLAERAAALDPHTAFDKSAVLADSDVVTSTDAVLTQGQIIGLLQEHARPGDTIIAAAGGPPGDLQKVWDATDRRYCFSCMGYEIPAGLGVRLAVPDRSKRVLSFIGDGTFLMAPTELVTALQERLAVTVVISENHGYQAIHRLQMWRSGQEFGNEFRYREDALMLSDGQPVDKPARLEGDYLQVDLVKIASGLGAFAIRATTAAEVRDALTESRDHDGPVVIVIPAIPRAELPAAGVWWDVAPAEVSDSESLAQLRDEYEAGLSSQRWFG
jgi:3D-(3,5/4)-trihydroxycyclohexane-1,2-dione acylhydrolase (decyclizing)